MNRQHLCAREIYFIFFTRAQCTMNHIHLSRAAKASLIVPNIRWCYWCCLWWWWCSNGIALAAPCHWQCQTEPKTLLQSINCWSALHVHLIHNLYETQIENENGKNLWKWQIAFSSPWPHRLLVDRIYLNKKCIFVYFVFFSFSFFFSSRHFNFQIPLFCVCAFKRIDDAIALFNANPKIYDN